MKKAVKIIAVIATIGLIANLIVLSIGLSNKEITWSVFFSSLLSNIIIVILLWALHYALNRIEILEEKIEKNRLEIASHKKVHREKIKDIYICPVCGCDIYNEEEICPNCKTPCKQV